MKITITKSWLKNNGACNGGFKWYLEQETEDTETLFNQAMKHKRFADINWVISKKLNKFNKLRYAIFAAEQVIDIFEKNILKINDPGKQ